MLPPRGSCREATEGEAPNCANGGDARRTPPLPLRGISPPLTTRSGQRNLGRGADSVDHSMCSPRGGAVAQRLRGRLPTARILRLTAAYSPSAPAGHLPLRGRDWGRERLIPNAPPEGGSCRAATEGEARNCANSWRCTASPPLPLRASPPQGDANWERGASDPKCSPAERGACLPPRSD